MNKCINDRKRLQGGGKYMLLSNQLGSSMATIHFAKGFLGNWGKTRNKMKEYSLSIKVDKLHGEKKSFSRI